MVDGSGAALAIRDLTVTYGRSVQALRQVSLDVPAGSVVTLLGGNGAGKSTLLRAVSSTLPLHGGGVEAGSITFGDTAPGGTDPSLPVRTGIVQVPEGRRVFAGMSVADNLRAGGLGGRRRSKAAVAATREPRPGDVPAAGPPPPSGRRGGFPAASSRCSRSGGR